MNPFDLSICIVSYEAKAVLDDCLESIYEKVREISYEIIVVDNGSNDNTKELVRTKYPNLNFIRLDHNQGYTKPMNQALKTGSGRYLMQLNPDTIVKENAFENLIEFMDNHPGTGICGPKVLNQDGTLQPPCRRGESKPWAVITYFLGLSSLFPRNKLFGEYLMSYMDENETHKVAGVAGSCMVLRRQLVEQIGYLDERFYAYQEDADICFRARQAGWSIYYVPAAEIIHLGGFGGSGVHPFRSIIFWHVSYYKYFKKNLSRDYNPLLNGFYYLAMFIKLIFSLIVNLFRKRKFAGLRKP